MDERQDHSVVPSPPPSSGVWGHLLVSASACLLTISILGSAVVLGYKGYRRYELKTKVRGFISSLENRTPEELAERADELRQRPKVAQHVLPELKRALANARSERQLCATIEISRAFLTHRSVEGAIFDLRQDPRESVAAMAVSVLGDIQPPERAAEVLGNCLDGADAGLVADAVVDEACAGLLKLGEPGLAEMRRRIAGLATDRRIWLAGYVNAVGGPYRRLWLEMLEQDSEPGVRDAATKALTGQRVATGG